MIENEKYYVKPVGFKNSISLAIIYVFSMTYLLVLTVDYSNINIAYMILLLLLIMFGVFGLILSFEIRKKKLFLYFVGDTLYKHCGFGIKREVTMKNDYIVNESKKGIHYIVINNEKGKPSLLIGGDYKTHFPQLIELLESKKNSTHL